MIQVARSIVRLFHTNLRRAVRRQSALRPVVSFCAGSDGLRIRSHVSDAALEYFMSDTSGDETIHLPLDALADFEGRDEATVRLEKRGCNVMAEWSDSGVLQSKAYEAPEAGKVPTWPALPDKMTPQDASLLHALADATHSAAHEATRFALTHLALRGSKGEVVATDGRQLLIQSGFSFPWQEDLLIPATPLLTCRELTNEEGLSIGNTKTHVVIQAGNWTLLLLLETSSRYPPVDQVVPALNDKITRWHVDDEDAGFLRKALPRLPAHEEDDAPVTVDLNGQALVRSRASGQERATELLLAHSGGTDKPAQFALNRRYLGRALDLGLREVAITAAEKPLLFFDDKRRLVIMPLSKSAIQPPGKDALRITSTGENEVPKSPSSEPERRNHPMKTTNTANGSANGTAHHEDTPETNGHSNAGYGALISEAEAIKTDLRNLFARVNQLVIAIKRHRKQAQGVQNMLSNLRQLETIGS